MADELMLAEIEAGDTLTFKDDIRIGSDILRGEAWTVRDVVTAMTDAKPYKVLILDRVTVLGAGRAEILLAEATRFLLMRDPPLVWECLR